MINLQAKIAGLLFVCCLAFCSNLLAACDDWAGAYSLEKDGHIIVLTLNANGSGFLIVDDYSDVIKWDPKEDSDNLSLFGKTASFKRMDKAINKFIFHSDADTSLTGYRGVFKECKLWFQRRLYVDIDNYIYLKASE